MSQENSIERFLRSNGAWVCLSEFLGTSGLLKMNLLNKLFYNDIVPLVMTNRAMYPSCEEEVHTIVRSQAIIMMSFNNSI